MKHQWLAYVIVALLSIGAGVAIAGLPDSVPQSETIVPPSTTVAPEPTLPTTTVAAATTTTEAPDDTVVPDDTEPESATTEPDEADDTTTTIDPLPLRAEVNVAVANGSGKAGVAVRTADELIALGYANIAALTGNDVVDVTVVYYGDGNDDVAERMAADLGLPPEAVEAIVLAPGVQDLGLVDLLVYIGTDRA